MIDDRAYLMALSRAYPNVDAALNRIAELTDMLALPGGTIHVISDIHGEHKKLRHIINNASGGVRALIEEVFGDRLSAAEKLDLQKLIYYPREAHAHFAGREFVRPAVDRCAELLRHLAARHALADVDAIVPRGWSTVFRELLLGRATYIDALAARFVAHDRDVELLRHLAHAVRNLLVDEVIVAGDLGDRGPRLDKVIDFLTRQPNVSIAWGNHDASWMAACLGHPASIATVLRVSVRHRRLSQIEEGYGITMAPLEKLARTVYADDPCERFQCKGTGLREAMLMARMHKAIAIIQFKLEAQLIARRADLEMGARDLWKQIDPARMVVRIQGAEHPLLDRHFPTVDWADPTKLSPDEQACIDRLRQSFLHSPVLWQHMRFVAERGAMWLERDRNVIFHGCLPVDEHGDFLPMIIDGEPRKGRALLDAFTRVVARAFRKKRDSDLDLLWYLWNGPRSPSFGKDKMATFETYYVADKATHAETKNPYFKLIHEEEFCRRVFAELGLAGDDLGLIVNGHVPVKLEHGESPVKKSGMAVTIDGAFSEAYGDRGYTLVIGPERTFLAQHHHFESVEESIAKGADIVPTITDVRVHARPRTIADTDRGKEARGEIAGLERLIEAYETNEIRDG